MSDFNTHSIGKYTINVPTGHSWSDEVKPHFEGVVGSSQDKFKDFLGYSQKDSQGRIHFTTNDGDNLVLVPNSKYSDNTSFKIVHKNDI